MRTEDVDDFLSSSNRYDSGSGFFTESARRVFYLIFITVPFKWLSPLCMTALFYLLSSPQKTHTINNKFHMK
jgi:hypothetical protein